MKRFILERTRKRWNYINNIIAKAKTIWIESTSGPSNKKPAKSKNNVKSPVKKEKSIRKTIISPFKKIYDEGEMAKLKIKHKSKSNAENSLKKDLEPNAKDSQRSEAIISGRRQSIEWEPHQIRFSSTKKCNPKIII
jgi:hypothetical protein